MASVELAKHQSLQTIRQGGFQEKGLHRAFAREICEVLPEFMNPIDEEMIHEKVSRKHDERTIEQVRQGVFYACDKGWLQKYGDDDSGWTFETTISLKFMTACKEADVSLVKEYLSDLDFNFKFLLEMPDRLEGYQSCPLVEAIDSEREGRNAVFDMLMERNAELPFSKDSEGNPFLNQEAMYAEKTKVVTYYLQEEDSDCVRLSAQSEMGTQPSDLAKECRNKVMIDFFNLVEEGVSRIFAGEVCQVLADSDNKMKVEDICNKVRVNSPERTIDAVRQGVELGIDKGWLFGVKYDEGVILYSLTPHMSCLLACKYGRLEQVKEYQFKEIEINFSLGIPYRPEGYLSSPLIEALDSKAKERLSIISVLKEMDVTMPKIVDGCFLHQEARCAVKTNVANYYLKNVDVFGKSLSVKNNRGESPYEVAIASGNDVMIQFFELRKKINDKVEQNARQVSLSMLKDMQPRSPDEFKQIHAGMQGVDNALKYACDKCWLRRETKIVRKNRQHTGRYEITPGLQLMHACRNGNVDVLSGRVVGNNRFWDVRMNMPDDLSGGTSSPLQEAIESSCEERSTIIRILEEGGACFYLVDSDDEKVRFLFGEIKNKHARVLQYFLEKYEESEHVLDFKDEAGKSISDCLRETACEKLMEVFESHREAVILKKVCKDAGQVVVEKTVVPCLQQAEVIAISDSGSSSGDESGGSYYLDEPGSYFSNSENVDSDSRPVTGAEDNIPNTEDAVTDASVELISRSTDVIHGQKVEYVEWNDLMLKRDDVAFNQFVTEKSYDSLRDASGNTPMHFLCKSEYYLGYIRRCESSRIDCSRVFNIASEKVERMLEICLHHGGSLHDKNDVGDTPLHLAVKTAFLPTIKLLVLCGKDKSKLFVRNDEGMTPLMLAIRSRNNVVVFELIQQGSNPDDVLGMGLLSLEYFANAVAKFEQDSLVGGDFLQHLNEKIEQIRSKQKSS